MTVTIFDPGRDASGIQALFLVNLLWRVLANRSRSNLGLVRDKPVLVEV